MWLSVRTFADYGKGHDELPRSIIGGKCHYQLSVQLTAQGHRCVEFEIVKVKLSSYSPWTALGGRGGTAATLC
jgi:hypothetical protein